MASRSSFHKKVVEVGKMGSTGYLIDIHHAGKVGGNCTEVVSDPTWLIAG